MKKKKKIIQKKKVTKKVARKVRKVTRRISRNSILKVEGKIETELNKIIQKIKKKRNKNFDHSEIIEGIIGMIKFYKLNNELESILFKEEVS